MRNAPTGSFFLVAARMTGTVSAAPRSPHIESIATQHGAHLLLDFGDGGAQAWLAYTTLAELAGVDILV